MERERGGEEPRKITVVKYVGNQKLWMEDAWSCGRALDFCGHRHVESRRYLFSEHQLIYIVTRVDPHFAQNICFIIVESTYFRLMIVVKNMSRDVCLHTIILEE